MLQKSGGEIGRRAMAVLVVSTLLSAAVNAQAPQPLAGPQSAVRPGQAVWLGMIDGSEHHGRVVSVSGEGLEVRDGARTIVAQWADVGLVETPDAIGDGIMKGAIAGALTGGIPAGVFIANYGECPCSEAWNFVAGYATLGAAIEAAVGALADGASRKRQVVYRRHFVSIAPALRPGTVAVAGSLVW